MSLKLPYVTLDVFATKPFVGNQLAIVTLPSPSTLTKNQQSQIAKEFNYSETVFILARPSSKLTSVPISIWTTEQELPFAGHPTVGTAFHLLNDHLENADQVTLETLAGDIPAKRDSSDRGRISIRAPHNIQVHENLAHSLVCATIGNLSPDYLVASDYKIPTISIVSGLAYVLIEVDSLEHLAQLTPKGKDHQFSYTKDLKSAMPEGSKTDAFVGAYCYVLTDDSDVHESDTLKIQARMFFEGDQEDAATGSAACALGAYLTIARKKETKIEIVQGAEMGRRSEIGISGTVDNEGKLKDIWLEGKAVKVMEGVLTL